MPVGRSSASSAASSTRCPRSARPSPRSFDPAGELLDTASPRLGGLRAAVRVAFDRLKRRLDSLVASELGNALQEPIITLRNGRYVVPVRAEAKGRVKGIVHDASGSGQTLFIEPLVVVELGNAWREAQAAEQAEVERILDELSALVGANVGPLRETLGALARFDLWAAKAQLAGEMGASRAETAKRPEVELLSARHPGLSGRVVPIDVRLGDGFTALVVTGPNTGGKTVTLRTLGLLALMHQAGLHIPAAPGSRLPIFRDVFADIGDEQSIAQSLSTFSGHMRSIIRIVEAAGPGTLVLLDELGAGTDPTEGSALAQALLDHFIKAGALVAATTHYAELKAYAHTTPGSMNASVEFDLETLSPTYRLTIGLPGRSQAFAIAERLGLPPLLVADARSRLSETQRTFEATLARISEVEGETAEAKVRAREAEVRAGEALRAAADERRKAQQSRADTELRAREEAARLVSELRAELEGVRQSLERGQLTAPAIDAVLERAEDRLARAPGASKGPCDEPRSRWRPQPRRRGASATRRAAAPAAGRAGSPSSTDRASARDIETGSMRVSVEVADLEPVGPAGPSFAAPKPVTAGTNAAAVQQSRAGNVPMSLDLRGARVDEALSALDRYLEDASLAGLAKDHRDPWPWHGSAPRRRAIRLGGPPAGSCRRAGERGEGGDGVTVVELG